MAFVLRNIGGTVQRADGEPLAEARILFRPIGIHGDDGVTILPPIIEAMTDEDGVLDVDRLTSDVPDAFVRYECTAATAEPFRFDLVNGPATTLDELFNASVGSAASSSMAVLLAAIAAVKPYKSYVARLEGTFSAAPPTVTVLENQLDGVPVWSYFSEGRYRVTLSGAFPEARTVAFITGDDGYYHLSATARDGGGNYVSVHCVRTSSGANENQGFYGGDVIEIRVYDE